MKYYRASLSIEAAYIMPLVLLCLFFPIWLGIDLQDEVKELVHAQQQEEITDIVFCMYRKEFVKELLGELYEK